MNAGRRRFLTDTARTAAGAGLFGSILALHARQTPSRPPELLRPPGALPEPDFLGACLRCGLCVQRCPPRALTLAGVGMGTAVGTPYFVARARPCEMCPDMPCVKACPTGALDKGLTGIAQARMGVAVMIEPERCFNLQGGSCDICWRVCPLGGKALVLEPRTARPEGATVLVPSVQAAACTGCGKCEKGCIQDPPAIRVVALPATGGRT